MKVTKEIKKIVELLPDNLSESLVTRIGEIIQEAIEEGVKSQIETLAVRTNALLRSKIDTLKEHAKKELELEDENFRNLELMKYIKGLFALEVGAVDNDVAARTVMEEAAEIASNTEQLAEQLDITLEENLKLEKTLKIMDREINKYKQKISLLESKLNENINQSRASEVILDDIKAPGFAKAIKGRSDRPVKDQDKSKEMGAESNPLITEEFLRLIK